MEEGSRWWLVMVRAGTVLQLKAWAGGGVTDEAVERVRTTLADALLNDQRVIALVQDWLVDEETAEMLAYQIIGGMQGDELHTMLIAVITGW
jgi:hypothetical protein